MTARNDRHSAVNTRTKRREKKRRKKSNKNLKPKIASACGMFMGKRGAHDCTTSHTQTGKAK